MHGVIVIIPAFNAEVYLQRAVSSVLNQPCKNIRIVIINDGSTDSTALICDNIAKNDDRVIVFHQNNLGVACARNVGIEFALEHSENDYEYIGFCDADDLWQNGCVTQDILDRSSTQRADIIGFSCWCTDQHAKRYNINNQYTSHVHRDLEIGTVDWMLNGPFCAHFYSIEMIRKFSLRFPINVSRNEDVIFMRQAVFCASNIMYRNETLYLYRTNMYSVTHQASNVIDTMVPICRAWYNTRYWASGFDIPIQKQEAWSNLCLQTSATILLETARNLAQCGYSPKKILSHINSEPYAEFIDTLVVENLAYWQQSDLILFRNNYKKFCRKHKNLGLIKKLFQIFLKIPLVRTLRDKKRFPNKINDVTF